MSRSIVLAASAMTLALGLCGATTPATAAAVCHKGYHVDAHGHCQPNHPPAPRHHCPPGYYAHVAPTGNGYRCKSYP